MRPALCVSVAALTVLATAAVGGCGSSEDPDTRPPTTVNVTVTETPATPTAPPSTAGPTSTSAQSSAPGPVPVPVPTPTVTVTEVPAVPAVPPRPSATADATAVVRAYFDAINRGDFARAWDLGGRRLTSSYQDFVAGFAKTASDRVTIVSVRGEVVQVVLDATGTDGSHRYFTGTYTVRGGVIVAADIRAVASQPPDSGAPQLYANCTQARAAGAAPMRIGEPGYAEELDRDRDGEACEPYDPG